MDVRETGIMATVTLTSDNGTMVAIMAGPAIIQAGTIHRAIIMDMAIATATAMAMADATITITEDDKEYTNN